MGCGLWKNIWQLSLKVCAEGGSDNSIDKQQQFYSLPK
jgi:hypothetical protein